MKLKKLPKSHHINSQIFLKISIFVTNILPRVIVESCNYHNGGISNVNAIEIKNLIAKLNKTENVNLNLTLWSFLHKSNRFIRLIVNTFLSFLEHKLFLIKLSEISLILLVAQVKTFLQYDGSDSLSFLVVKSI